MIGQIDIRGHVCPGGIFHGRIPVNRFGIIDTKKAGEMAKKIIEDFGLPIEPGTKVKDLSIAYRQMVEIMKAYSRENLKVICFDEPTKGIDVGAKAEFYQMICQFAKQGLGVILISSELPEVIGLSDRIIVMKSREIVGEVSREEATESGLLNLLGRYEEAYKKEAAARAFDQEILLEPAHQNAVRYRRMARQG